MPALTQFNHSFPSTYFLILSLQIVISFFSLLIKDIYFLNEGCANRLPNGHVNFEVGQSPLPAPRSPPKSLSLRVE